jgi:tetratricopeptide (TPR) repeat protein
MPIAANRLTRSSASKSRGTLAPSDPLIFLAAVGIAAAHFEAYRYDEAVHWYRRALVEQPKAVWINRFLTAGFALAGRKDEAKRSLCTLLSAFPSLTISQIRIC